MLRHRLNRCYWFLLQNSSNSAFLWVLSSCFALHGLFTSSLWSRNVHLTIPLVPFIALSFDHQNHSKWHKWCHVRYSLQGIIRQPIPLHSMSSNVSKARELEIKPCNSSPLIRTSERCRLVRLRKGPSSDVGWKVQLPSSRYRSEFLTPSDKSDTGNLYFFPECRP